MEVEPQEGVAACLNVRDKGADGEGSEEACNTRDGVLEGRQHHTLDMELFGPSSWLEGLYLAALSAAVQIRKTYSLLGLFMKNAKEYKAWYEEKNTEDIPADVKAVAEERWAARQNRDWAKSDELRAKLTEMGYAVKDSKTGYELTKI